MTKNFAENIPFHHTHVSVRTGDPIEAIQASDERDYNKQEQEPAGHVSVRRIRRQQLSSKLGVEVEFSFSVSELEMALRMKE